VSVDHSPEAPAVGVHPDDVVANPVRLGIFCRVVERQSFGRAADDLLVTRPAVSMHVRALEEAFGARLFDRRRRGAHLTEAGRAVYEFAVTVRRDIVALRAQLNDLAGGRAGVVTLGATQTLGSYALPDLLASFHCSYPAMRLRLRIGTSDRITEEVLRGQLDLGIVTESISISPALRVEPLWTETEVLIAAPDHRLAGQARVALADLVGERFILGPGRSIGDRALDMAMAQVGLPPRQVVMEVGTPEGAKRAVRRGIGLVVMFRRAVAAELAAGQLVVIPLEVLPATEQLYLIARRAHRFSPLAQNLMAFLRAAARDPLGGNDIWPASAH
jgi:DNA-binding transcriptional LysR family regulator